MRVREASQPEVPFEGVGLSETYEKPVNEATRGQAIAPLVLGALAAGALFVRPVGVYLAFVLSIVGVALGTRGAKKGSPMATAGRALSVAALCVSSIVILVGVATGAQALRSVIAAVKGMFGA